MEVQGKGSRGVGETREVTQLGPHRAYVRGMAFSPNGKRLASGGEDKTVRIWSVTDRKQTDVMTDFDSEVHAVAFSHDSRLVAAGSGDWGNEGTYSHGAVKVWDPNTGRTVDLGTPTPVWSVAFSPDDTLLAAACGNIGTRPSHMAGEIRIWNMDRIHKDLEQQKKE